MRRHNGTGVKRKCSETEKEKALFITQFLITRSAHVATEETSTRQHATGVCCKLQAASGTQTLKGNGWNASVYEESSELV